VPAEIRQNTGATLRRDPTDERIAALLSGIEVDPVKHVQTMRFATDLLLMDSATRLRACRAAVAILSRAEIYASGVVSTLLDYLRPDEVKQFKRDLANRQFFTQNLPELGEEMILSDLPAWMR
jgi:hypothetical protein